MLFLSHKKVFVYICSIKSFHFNCCCDTGKIFPVFRNIMLSCGSVDLQRCGEHGGHGECEEH